MSKPSVKQTAMQVLDYMQKRYPAPQSVLDWKNPWELLVATALAAQCTDERVNKVTPVFFKHWPDIASLADARAEDVEQVIHSTGFYRNKSKNLIGAAQKIMSDFKGQVPQSMAELVTLPGVARKTANIVLSNAFGLHEGIAVDTHVKRLSFRLGLTNSQNPIQVEKDLMPLLPKQVWGDFNHYLVLFGREICKARKPLCSLCDICKICPQVGVEVK